VGSITHFNTYNKIGVAAEKGGVNLEEISVLKDCAQSNVINTQKLLSNASSNVGIPATTQTKYNKLKNTYLTLRHEQPKPFQRKVTADEALPDFMGNNKKVKLNESTYYNTKGQNGEASTYFASLKNNVKTILGVKD